jgi:hypothetical protein
MLSALSFPDIDYFFFALFHQANDLVFAASATKEVPLTKKNSLFVKCY